MTLCRRFGTAVGSRRDPFALNIDTVPLSYQRFGPDSLRSKAIVFLHGFCGNKVNNRTSARVLAKEFGTQVYCVDLRNHGDSPHSNLHDYAALASDVEGFIEEHQLEKPVVIGHSMGAKTAMAIPLRRPELCSLVIAVDNGPEPNIAAAGEFEMFEKRLKALQKIVRPNSGVHSIEQLDYILSEVEPSKLVRMFMLLNLQRVSEAEVSLGRKSPSLVRWKSKIPLQILIDHIDELKAWDFGDQRHWDGPALLIRLLQSPFVDGYTQFRKIFPNGFVKEIDSSHWVITEHNKAFNKICIDFLKDNVYNK